MNKMRLYGVLCTLVCIGLIGYTHASEGSATGSTTHAETSTPATTENNVNESDTVEPITAASVKEEVRSSSQERISNYYLGIQGLLRQKSIDVTTLSAEVQQAVLEKINTSIMAVYSDESTAQDEKERKISLYIALEDIITGNMIEATEETPTQPTPTQPAETPQESTVTEDTQETSTGDNSNDSDSTNEENSSATGSTVPEETNDSSDTVGETEETPQASAEPDEASTTDTENTDTQTTPDNTQTQETNSTPSDDTTTEAQESQVPNEPQD